MNREIQDKHNLGLRHSIHNRRHLRRCVLSNRKEAKVARRVSNFILVLLAIFLQKYK